MKTVITVLKSGGAFEPQHVKDLHRALTIHCDEPIRMLCLTDLTQSMRWSKSQRFIQMPLHHNLPGRWSKLEIFRPIIRLRFYPATYIDLDTAIVGPMKDVLSPKAIELIMLRDFHHPEKPASGMMYLPREDGRILGLWKMFINNAEEIMQADPKQDDGRYIAEHCPPGLLYQEIMPGRILTYKPTRKTRLDRVPPEASVVCFHGEPRPWDIKTAHPWLTEYYDKTQRIIVNRPKRERDKTIVTPSSYSVQHEGTLLVLGSAEGGLEELDTVRECRPEASVMSIGHAAGMTKADFVMTDHYEVHSELRALQDRYHTEYSTHCTRASGWQKYPAVDYWWDLPRAIATSAESAIDIGLAMGFDEIILCGCPLEGGTIQHPKQREKDGDIWPPPRDLRAHGRKLGEETSDEILATFRRNFLLLADKWLGHVFSMGGYTQSILGSPPRMLPAPSVLASLSPVSILCPSRGRPALALKMATTAREKANGPVEILLYIDADDPCKEEYAQISDVRLFVGRKQRTVGEAWNYLANRCEGNYLMMGNDDLVFETPGWDSILRAKTAEYQDGIYVAWFDDGTGKAKQRCAFPIVSRRWYETLGSFTPECFNFLWHDTWVTDVGRRLNRLLHIPEVLVEHRHFSVGKALKDDTYQRHREGKEAREKRKQDESTYKAAAGDRESEATLLRTVMEGAGE